MITTKGSEAVETLIAAHLVNGVDSGEGKDISARDGFRTRMFKFSFDLIDDVEVTEAEVNRRVFLCNDLGGGVQQHRGIASLNEAVVEEQAHEGSRIGGVDFRVLTHNLLHDSTGLRTALLVEIEFQTLFQVLRNFGLQLYGAENSTTCRSVYGARPTSHLD